MEAERQASSQGQPLRRCPVCKYPLSGLPAHHRCPECGFEYDERSRIWHDRILLRRGIVPFVAAIELVILTAIAVGFALFSVTQNEILAISGTLAACAVVWIAFTLWPILSLEHLVMTGAGLWLIRRWRRNRFFPWSDVWVPLSDGDPHPPWHEQRSREVDRRYGVIGGFLVRERYLFRRGGAVIYVRRAAGSSDRVPLRALEVLGGSGGETALYVLHDGWRRFTQNSPSVAVSVENPVD